jgi:hypothetical protein
MTGTASVLTEYRPFSAGVRLLVFGVLAVVTLLLGLIGFAEYLPSRPEFGRGLLDRLFYSIQLFFVAAEPVKNGSPMPVTLNVARFCGPIVTASALLEVVAAVFATQRQQWRARSAKRHTVVCGGGGDALLLVNRLRSTGENVVLVERQPSAETVNVCKRVKVPIVVGDPTDEAVLRSAGTTNADAIYALSSDSAINTSIAVTSRTIRTNGRGQLTCFALVPDRDLRAALLARGLDGSGDQEFQLVLFSTDEIAARVLAQKNPLTVGTLAVPPHVVVAGLDDFGQTLALEFARRWRVHVNRGHPKLVLTIAGPDAVASSEQLRRQFPALEEICDIRSLSTSVTSLPEHTGVLETADRVYVCADDDVLGIKTGLSLLRLSREREVQIVVRVCERGVELDEAFRGINGRLFDDVSGSLRIFGTLNEACHPAAIQAGVVVEEIARSLHDEYVAQCAANGDMPLTNPSMDPWEDLVEDLKDANRAQARHVGEKLRTIGCIAVPGFDDTMPFAFRAQPDEVEQLARLEHRRWAAERRAQGYTYGPNREERRHPNLVDWEELPDSAREKNRVFVRALPRVLASAGFQILRVCGSAPALVRAG